MLVRKEKLERAEFQARIFELVAISFLLPSITPRAVFNLLFQYNDTRVGLSDCYTYHRSHRTDGCHFFGNVFMQFLVFSMQRIIDWNFGFKSKSFSKSKSGQSKIV